MRQERLEDVVRDVQSNLNEVDQRTNDHLMELNDQQNSLNKIDEKLGNVENTVKAVKWYTKGIESFGGWMKNMFTTPSMKNQSQPHQETAAHKIIEETQKKETFSNTNHQQQFISDLDQGFDENKALDDIIGSIDN